MKRILAVIAIVIVALAILRPATILDRTIRSQPSPTSTVSQTETGVRGLVVLPDDGPDAILDEMNGARSSIDLYVYLLPSDEVLSALSAAHDRGVAIRVILERDPFGGGNSNQDAYDRLAASGIAVRWSSDQFQFSHIKTFVVDQRVAVVMTLNLSWSALTRNREFAVVSTIPADVQEVSRLFEADWTGRPYAPESDFVTSPENSRATFRSLIVNATASIDIYAEVVRDADIRLRLADAAARGVTVRILVPANPTADVLQIYRDLERDGVQVRLLADAYSHAKAIIVDGSSAFVGSQNLTQTSLDKNRELGIILTDQPNLDRLRHVFESDWAISPAAS
jgi:phosphatidylserine/phosphatidylglycerophosphate/cardiolipin synthase-like enzyme